MQILLKNNLDPPKRVAIVLLTGSGSVALYLLLAWLYPLLPSLQQPRAAWASLVDGEWYRAGTHFAIYLAVTLLYILALRMVLPGPGADSRSPDRLPVPAGLVYIPIILVWLASSAALMSMAPGGESHDIFDYIFRGRMMTELDANPLVDIPKDYSKEPYFKYLAWTRSVDTYGPLWESASAGISATVRTLSRALEWWSPEPSCPESPESCRLLVVYLSGYRLFAVTLVGVAGLLVVSLVVRGNPALGPAALLAWLWSPMTLFTSALGGHNDILMLVLSLLCLLLLQRSRPTLALIALVLALHVKLVALMWLPVVALWIVHRWSWRRALVSGLLSLGIGLGISFLLYAPFDGWDTLPRMLDERTRYLANSAWRVINRLIYTQWHMPRDWAWRLTTDLPTLLFGLLAILVPLRRFNLLPKRWRRDDTGDVPTDRLLWGTLTIVSLLYLLVGSYWFQSWYVIWVIVPAVLLPDHRFTRSVLPWLVFGALSANLAQSLLRAPDPNPLSPNLIDLISVVIIWLPALLAAMVPYLKRFYK